MILVFAVLLLALSALSFLLALSYYRRPNRPAWTGHEDRGAYVTLGIMLLGAFGLALLLKFGIEFRTQSLTLLDAVLAAAILGGAVFAGRQILAGYRRSREAPSPEPRDMPGGRRARAAGAAVPAAAQPKARLRKAA